MSNNQESVDLILNQVEKTLDNKKDMINESDAKKEFERDKFSYENGTGFILNSEKATIDTVSTKLIPNDLKEEGSFDSNIKKVEINDQDFKIKKKNPEDFGGWKSTIHFIWWQGAKDLLQNQNSQKRINSWKNNFPKAVIRSWDEKSLEQFIKESYGFNYYNIWKNDLKTPKEKVIWAKYLLLLHFGGIVPHVDLECLGPFQIPNSNTKLTEKDTNPHLVLIKEDHKNINLQFIASERGAGFWKAVLQESLRMILRNKIYFENHDFEDVFGKRLLSKVLHNLEKEKSNLIHRIFYLEKSFIQKSSFTEIRNYILGPQDNLIETPKLSTSDQFPIYDHCEHRWERKSSAETQSIAVGLLTIFFIGLIIIGLLIWEHITLGKKFQNKDNENISLGKDPHFHKLQNKMIQEMNQTPSNNNWFIHTPNSSIQKFENQQNKKSNLQISNNYESSSSSESVSSSSESISSKTKSVNQSISNIDFDNAFRD